MSSEWDLLERLPARMPANLSGNRIHAPQRRDDSRDPGEHPEVNDILRSPGRPMEPELRGFMQSRFGHDFSRIKIHDDMRASESALSIDAQAYTVGEHIVFRTGQYAPDTPSGRRLIAHELSHTIQQRGTIVGPKEELRFSSEDSSEREARSAADNILHARSFTLRINRPVGIALQGTKPQNQTVTTDPDDIGSRSWSIKYHGSGGAIVNVAFFELKNLATGRIRQLMFMGGGLSAGITTSGPGLSGATAKSFETPNLVNFNDFNWAGGRLTSAGAGVGYGYSLTYLTMWNADGNLVAGLPLHGFGAMAMPSAGVYFGTFKLL